MWGKQSLLSHLFLAVFGKIENTFFNNPELYAQVVSVSRRNASVRLLNNRFRRHLYVFVWTHLRNTVSTKSKCGFACLLLCFRWFVTQHFLCFLTGPFPRRSNNTKPMKPETLQFNHEIV